MKKLFLFFALFVIFILKLEAQPLSFEADTVCEGTETSFTNTSVFVGNPLFRWEFYSKDNVIAAFDTAFTSNQPVLKYKVGKAGEYVVKLFIEGADNPAVREIKVYRNPVVTINALASPNLCYGRRVAVEAATNDQYNYMFWNTGEITKKIIVPKHIAFVGDSNYTVTIVDKNFCVGRKTINIKLFALPVIKVNGTQEGLSTLKKADTLQLNATGAEKYYWKPALGMNATNIANPRVSPYKTVTYTVIGTASEKFNRCVDSTHFTVKITLPNKPIPNAYNTFTPNGDGKNDTWKIDNNTDLYLGDENNCTLYIYDSWGQEVYKTESPNKGWQGWDGNTNDGNEVLDGTYYYVIKDKTNSDNTYTGFITIVR